MSCSALDWEAALKRRQYEREYREFVQRLKRARMDAGITQEAAAKAFGVPQSFISKCESGERRVDVVELQQFAKLYGRQLSDFLKPEIAKL